MCPHGYHHSGSMATPALGTRDVRLHIVWIALWSHQSAQTASSELSYIIYEHTMLCWPSGARDICIYGPIKAVINEDLTT